MKLHQLTHSEEKTIIRFGIILFWWLFWLFNVVDKFIPREAPFWLGSNRYGEFIEDFDRIGIHHPQISLVFLIFVTVLEIITFLFLTSALKFSVGGKTNLAHKFFFLGILAPLLIFSLFIMGDEIFGNRIELLAHSIYWILLVFSWFVYTRAEES